MAHTKKCFTKLYQTSTLHEAIKRAAKIERQTSFQYPHNKRNIPFNVRGIAWKRGIRIGPSLPKNTKEDAPLRQNGRLEVVIKLETIRLQLLKAFHICEILCHFLNHGRPNESQWQSEFESASQANPEAKPGKQ
jgi:hypothetical protein